MMLSIGDAVRLIGVTVATVHRWYKARRLVSIHRMSSFAIAAFGFLFIGAAAAEPTKAEVEALIENFGRQALLLDFAFNSTIALDRRNPEDIVDDVSVAIQNSTRLDDDRYELEINVSTALDGHEVTAIVEVVRHQASWRLVSIK